VLGSFVCSDIADSWYLNADFTIQCFDTRWDKYAILSGVMIFVYPVGIPLLFFGLLVSNRRTLLAYDAFDAQEHHRRTASSINSTSMLAGKEARKANTVRTWLGFLMESYRNEAYLFEICDLTHKVFMTAIVPFFAFDAQLIAAMVGSSIYILIILLAKPFVRRRDDQLQLLCQVELFLLLLCAYNAMNDASYGGPGSTEDIVLSAVLLALTGFLFLFVIYSLLRYVRDEYYKVLRDTAKVQQELDAEAEWEGAKPTSKDPAGATDTATLASAGSTSDANNANDASMAAVDVEMTSPSQSTPA